MTEVEQILSKPQMSILQSTAAINLFLAGTGSGKTFLGGVLSINFVSKFPDVRGAIFANTYDQLNTSTLFRIREYWASIGVTEWSKENPAGLYVSGKEPPAMWTKCKRNFDRFTNIISFANGGLIFTGSLDNYETHSGKEFAWCLLDETKDTKEEAVKEVIITRMRQPGMFIVDGKPSAKGGQHEQWNPLYCLTSPAKSDWLAEMFELDKYVDEITEKIYSDKTFFEKEYNNKKVVISSAYHNVHNVGENYINTILANNTEERGRALVFGNPFATTGGEFYSSFNRIEHVDNLKYDPDRPLHVSFDQNSVPYNSCSIWQFEQKDDLWWAYCIDEIALENPRNSTEEVCEELVLRYPNHKSGLFYYGDASGRARSTMNKDFRHHYEIVEFKLRRYLVAKSDRTVTRNPPLVKRRDFINKIFENKLPIRIRIDEGCKKMIADMLYVKQAIDGGKDKHIVTDKVTGDKYQKYGHLSDTCLIMGTKVLTSDGNKSIEDIRRGDLVLTRTGYHEVTNIKCMGYKDVCTYRIGDKEITCTEDHKIFAGDQFIMVSSLIAKNILCIFAIKKTWKERLLSMMGLSFTDTPKHNDPVIGITLRDGQSKTESGKKQHFTDLYGRNITERLRKGLQFITSTGTSVITGLKTYLSLHIRNTSEDITSEVHKNTKICLKECCETKRNPKQPSGMVLMPEENGIKNTQKLQFTESHTKWIVRSVKRVSYQGSETHRYIVQEDVSQDMLPGWQEMLKSTTKTERAFIAEKHSAPINGIKLQPVLASVQQIGEKKNAIVYDITINGAHEYFANGILVHNCDYLITEAFNNYFEA